MAYYYKQSEPGLWTVGCDDGGRWEPESDHNTPDKAAARVAYLNGGATEKAEQPSRRPDGGQAFPVCESDNFYARSGMTLRDYFAGQFLAGATGAAVTLQVDDYSPGALASDAYLYADAMLAARAK